MRHHSRTRKTLSPKNAKDSITTQTSLRLPVGLYDRAKDAVEAGATGSINELLIRALTAYLRALERRAIDAAFRPMAKDAKYRQDALKLSEEFSVSDAESLQLSERDLVET